jgi:hypothetical protein
VWLTIFLTLPRTASVKTVGVQKRGRDCVCVLAICDALQARFFANGVVARVCDAKCQNAERRLNEMGGIALLEDLRQALTGRSP